ncbi:MAG: hypothetical protein IIB00_06975 [candidate division Zixibacteria bacterium]|nr:hypothetical protein [candidate division Zixibacteria bacterium]
MNKLNQLRPKAQYPIIALSVLASLLLLAVFTVGCSERNLSTLSSYDASNLSEAPTLTESEQAQFDIPLLMKPGGSSDATYRVTFSGDITGGPSENTIAAKPNSSSVPVNPIELNLAYFQTALADGGSCFSVGAYSGPLQIHIEKNTVDSAQSHFYFRATGSDGVTEIKYVLTMNGKFADPNNFPPADGTQNTIMMTDWDMAIGASKKDGKIACTGEGTFSSGVTILIERIS